MSNLRVSAFTTLLVMQSHAHADGITLGSTTGVALAFLVIATLIAALLQIGIHKAKRLRLTGNKTRYKSYLFLVPATPVLLYPIVLAHEAIEFYTRDTVYPIKIDIIYMLIAIIYGLLFISFTFYFFRSTLLRAIVSVCIGAIFVLGVLMPQLNNIIE